jgi:hypothetical protein
LKNLCIESLADDDSLDVTVAPGGDKLFLVRKMGALNEAASYKLQCFSRLIYDKVLTSDDFIERGKKN